MFNFKSKFRIIEPEKFTTVPEGAQVLSDEQLRLVSGGDQIVHLPQSIHMDYGKLSIDQNPTRLA